MLNPGKYRAQAVGTYFGYSTAKGTPYVEVTFAVVDEGPHFGEKIEWQGWLPQPVDSSDAAAEKAAKQAERVAKTLVTLGYTGDDPEEFGAGDAAVLCPNVVSIDVQAESFNGRDRVKVAWINPVGSALADDAKSAFKASMKASFAAARASAGVPTTPRPVPRPTPTADHSNEIPF